MRGDSGDIRLSGNVGQEYVHGHSSDSESNLSSLIGPLIEPRMDDRSSDDSVASEKSRRKIHRGFLLPPVIYMLLVRVCGIVIRLFEPNPLPGTTRIRWRCVSHSQYVYTCSEMPFHMMVNMQLLWLLTFWIPAMRSDVVR